MEGGREEEREEEGGREVERGYCIVVLTHDADSYVTIIPTLNLQYIINSLEPGIT